MYTYHYYGMFQMPNGNMKHSDGTVSVRNSINSGYLYQKLKEEVAKLAGSDIDNFIMCNLSLINREEK